MSALALCLLSLDELHKKEIYPKEIFLDKASHYARLASGSACRSVFPTLCLWEKEAIAAKVFIDVHPDFTTLLDSILIVDESEKKVSSTSGHSLMEAHPFREARFKQAESNLENLILSMKKNDFKSFSEIVENEALTLHALMMSSTPPALLLKPESLEIIAKINEYREKTKTPITFTIDAGPNIHVIYPLRVKDEVRKFLENSLWPLKKIIHDEVGLGPIKN
jgi:diphosphomevalonate decarboxylase